jgi:hypothetical protein
MNDSQLHHQVVLLHALAMVLAMNARAYYVSIITSVVLASTGVDCVVMEKHDVKLWYAMTVSLNS